MDNMVTSVEIDRLKVRAFHGVLEQERKVGNDFEVTVKVDFPWDIDSDSIDNTLNYAELIALIQKEVDIPSALLEHVAGRIYRRISSRWDSVTGGYIRIAKLTPPVTAQLAAAAVSLAWGGCASK